MYTVVGISICKELVLHSIPNTQRDPVRKFEPDVPV